MIFELVGAAIMSGLGTRVIGGARAFYGLTQAWWKGAFTPDDAAISIANMIDSDQTCEWWVDGGYLTPKMRDACYEYRDYRTFHSQHLKTTVLWYRKYYNDDKEKRCGLLIEKPDGEILKCPISSYDDYLLWNAMKSWRKRKARLDKFKELRTSQELIDERIARGYIDQIEMIEKRILGKAESETADQLRACLPSPGKPKEVEAEAKVTQIKKKAA